MILGSYSQGTIGPAPKIAAGQLTKPRVAAFLTALNDGANYAHGNDYVPCKCVDGRPRADGRRSLGPDAAGGTVSLAVGDALTFDQFCKPGERAPEHTARIAQFWIDRQQRVGGHDAENAHSGSGCGACDKLEQSLVFIATHGDWLRDFIAQLGVSADDKTHHEVVKNARNLTLRNYAANGLAIVAALRNVAGNDAVETLTGEHNEIAVVINTRSQTTLDRGALRAQFGDDMQAFNVDVWALKLAIAGMCADARKAAAYFYAVLCYNVAVAAVLSDSSLHVVVR